VDAHKSTRIILLQQLECGGILEHDRVAFVGVEVNCKRKATSNDGLTQAPQGTCVASSKRREKHVRHNRRTTY
jgi:hypothetical protein